MLSFNILPTHKLKTIFRRRNTSYNRTLVLQFKIVQHYWWYSTILVVNTISNIGKFGITRFFWGKMVVEILITLTQKINDCWQQPLMKILAIRIANHLRTIFPMLSLLSLLSQPNDIPCQCTTCKTLFYRQYPFNSKTSPLAGIEYGSQ